LFRAADGSIRQDFTGRLEFSWPQSAMPVSYTAAGSVSGALYPRGFGLSVTQQPYRRRLAESPNVPLPLRARDTLFHAGHVTAPWSLYVNDPTAGVRLTTAAQPSPGGAVTVQLDPPAVRTTWSGRMPGVFTIGGRAADFRALARAGATIDVRYRVELHPEQSVRVGMFCEAPYGTRAPADASAAPIDWALCGSATGALLDMTARFASAPIGSWQTVSIPLACLTTTGADLSHVSAPFAVASSGKFAVSFSEVGISRNAGKTTCH
jgi:beta-glucosidase